MSWMGWMDSNKFILCSLGLLVLKLRLVASTHHDHFSSFCILPKKEMLNMEVLLTYIYLNCVIRIMSVYLSINSFSPLCKYVVNISNFVLLFFLLCILLCLSYAYHTPFLPLSNLSLSSSLSYSMYFSFYLPIFLSSLPFIITSFHLFYSFIFSLIIPCLSILSSKGTYLIPLILHLFPPFSFLPPHPLAATLYSLP